MRLPSFKRLSREDMKEAPDWIQNLIFPLNSFMDTIYAVTSGQLTFGDNMMGQFRNLNFKTLATYTTHSWTPIVFPNPLNKKVEGIMVVQASKVADNYQPIYNPVSVDWIQLNSNIQINYIAGLDNSSSYNVRILIL